MVLMMVLMVLMFHFIYHFIMYHFGGKSMHVVNKQIICFVTSLTPVSRILKISSDIICYLDIFTAMFRPRGRGRNTCGTLAQFILETDNPSGRIIRLVV